MVGQSIKRHDRKAGRVDLSGSNAVQRHVPHEFETRYQALLQQAKDQFDDEEPPWLPDDAYSIFKKLLTGERELRSREWITALENKLVGLAAMTSTEANCLDNETLRPPPCLTAAHSAKLITIRKKREKHLNSHISLTQCMGPAIVLQKAWPG